MICGTLHISSRLVRCVSCTYKVRIWIACDDEPLLYCWKSVFDEKRPKRSGWSEYRAVGDTLKTTRGDSLCSLSHPILCVRVRSVVGLLRDTTWETCPTTRGP